eukprot:scpid38264/ scgid13397/ 
MRNTTMISNAKKSPGTAIALYFSRQFSLFDNQSDDYLSPTNTINCTCQTLVPTVKTVEASQWYHKNFRYYDCDQFKTCTDYDVITSSRSTNRGYRSFTPE